MCERVMFHCLYSLYFRDISDGVVRCHATIVAIVLIVIFNKRSLSLQRVLIVHLGISSVIGYTVYVYIIIYIVYI